MEGDKTYFRIEWRTPAMALPQSSYYSWLSTWNRAVKDRLTLLREKGGVMRTYSRQDPEGSWIPEEEIAVRLLQEGEEIGPL